MIESSSMNVYIYHESVEMWKENEELPLGLKKVKKVFKFQKMTVPGQWSKFSIIFYMGPKDLVVDWILFKGPF